MPTKQVRVEAQVFKEICGKDNIPNLL